MSATEPNIDVVIVGGGVAGLTAAYRLRHRRILLLEEQHRPGGRLLSEQRGQYWLNWGAHMFGGPGTRIGDLTSELGLEARPISGRLVGIIFRDKRALAVPPELYPLVLPLSGLGRLSLTRAGLVLRAGAGRFLRAIKPRAQESAAERCDRLLAFEEQQTLAAMLGPVGGETEAILIAMTERNGADPAEMSAGHALRSFTNVWSKEAPGCNLVGGSSRFTDALATALGGRIALGARVAEIRRHPLGVRVAYDKDGARMHVTARQAILATPAFETRKIAPELPEDTLAALDAVRYGAFLTAAVLTAEKGPMPWDRNYAILTPGLSFSVIFNQAIVMRDPDQPRLPGGSLMLFRGAQGAAELLQRSDAEIETIFRADLIQVFPEIDGLVSDIAIQRWPAGAPYGFPGRAALQPALTDGDLSPFALAGDYLEFPNMEAAAAAGETAAITVLSRFS